MFLSPHWAVCTLPHFARAIEGLSAVLQQPVPKIILSNEASARDLPSANNMTPFNVTEFRRRVPWDSVKSIYAVDQAWYEGLQLVSSGCVFRSSSVELRALLKNFSFVPY